MKKISLAALIQILLVSFLGASGSQETDQSLHVVATTSIITDVVSIIGGDYVDLKGLIAPGQDPHSYEPAPRDIARVEEADIIFVNGFDLEEGLLSIIETVNPDNMVEVSRQITALELEEDDEHDHEAEDHHHEAGDPHTWMSPLNVMSWADVIAEELSSSDPGHGSYYHARAEAYKEKLRQLHLRMLDTLAVLVPEQRVLVTDHNLFGYFARDYQFTVIGTMMPGFSSSSESSSRETAHLIDLLNEHNIRAVFIGESSGEAIRKLAETLRRESKHDIIVKEMLTGSLHKRGLEGDSYIRFMEYNTNQIVSGLTR